MENLKILLSRFEDGSATDAEKRQLLEELSLNEETLKELLHTDYQRIVENGISTLSREDSREIFRLIQAKKEAAVTQEQHEAGKADLRRFIKPALRYAAAAVIIGIVAFGGLIWNKTQKANEPHQLQLASYPVQKTDTITNSGNTTLEKRLADGTVVWLETGSRLTFSTSFGATNRDIDLIGKATFNVAKGSTKPFTVLAKGLATTALGTKFSVNAYNDDVSVRLFEGKVVVKPVRLNSGVGPGSGAILTYLLPGDEFNMNMQTFKYAKTQFNVGGQNRHEVSRSGKDELVLQFDKTPLNEVFDKISKRYKVTIRYNKQEVSGLPFTGSFLASDSLRTMLKVLCYTNDLTFTEKGTTFYITK